MPAGRFGSEAAGTLDVWLYDHSGPKEAADVLGFLYCATYCAGRIRSHSSLFSARKCMTRKGRY